ncbi:hypothetical protein BAUCODRAFT_37809 [Baudoinia panamericana UAMH 10762]|uniref:VPS9 domain-containing protein n=1 Tax=Baudoinia panamericana (strain UAMH 10762) TaxID=717646 RepID=M2N1R0_BAUPA|nr:uncharacterized protein BAUCODRAFT_37809 [Baudoinia panamericana UAMH 10762]EMC92899.1 hypothetical protein BAUCODRAFT_37809 [Baudoinia panamericana UAMH 10762]
MSGVSQRSVSDSRPGLHGSQSFIRMPASPSATSPRKRASTLQEAGIPAIPEARHIDGSPEVAGKRADVFENHDDEEEHVPSGAVTPNPELKIPSTFDDLPIEIKSLSERFLESLSAKVHAQPLAADALSELFQDFYERAASHIATHIASLASRIGRDKGSSTPSKPSGRARAGSGAKRVDDGSVSGGEMLTASEVAYRKKARRLLELKRIALEEAVERGVCEKVYDRIFKHRSTDDEARDEKLRSRTAALSVVGIGLKELHTDSDPAKAEVRKTAAEKEEDISQSLASAREALQRMDDEHYPAGKLRHLTDAHKSIVETLSELFPSSSSADEILPTLIYTLITSPPEGISVVSNLNFIQRFRAQSKVDGEAAYCLVNLEAAISFLETVDLSSLRADELPEGPAKSSSRPSTPTSERSPPTHLSAARALKPTVAPITATSPELSSSSSDPAQALPSPRTPTPMTNRPAMHQRRLSNLVQAQADRLEAGRENFLNAADKIYDSINGTLENSLQFVFGRFKEQATGDSPLPKTLEEARKLVSSPSLEEQDESLNISGRSSPALDDPTSTTSKIDNKMLEILGGRKPPLRDRSVDSTRSAGSGKRVAFSDVAAKEKPKEDSAAAASTSANILNAINPLNRFGVPGFPRFGRGAGNISAQPSPTVEKPNKLDNIVERPSMDDAAEAFPNLEKQRTKESIVSTTGDDLNAREALAELRKIKPPKKRFLAVSSASDLRLGEVEELLMEYRRLAKAIGEAVAV